MIAGRPPLDLPSPRMLLIPGVVVLAIVLLLLTSCGPGPVAPEAENTELRNIEISQFGPWERPRRLPWGEWFTWGDIQHPDHPSTTVAVTVRLWPDGRVEGSVDDEPIPASWHTTATELLRAAAGR